MRNISDYLIFTSNLEAQLYNIKSILALYSLIHTRYESDHYMKLVVFCNIPKNKIVHSSQNAELNDLKIKLILSRIDFFPLEYEFSVNR